MIPQNHPLDFLKTQYSEGWVTTKLTTALAGQLELRSTWRLET
jgi:hypothetical protein